MKKYLKIFITLTEIGVVIWSVKGMLSAHSHGSACKGFSLVGGCEYFLPLILAYFLSAVLILYLLKKWEN